MTSVLPSPAAAALRPLPLVCSACGEPHVAAPTHICPACLGPLEPVYDPHRVLPTRDDIATRPQNLWRYREWLPFDGEPVVSTDIGWTPLVEAPRLARVLGVARCWIKNDALSFPSLSFKDRVVATALNAARAFDIAVVGCASTGNLANAVAAHTARIGTPAWIFVPESLEHAKVVGTAVYGARLVRVRGTYDDVNRLCAQVADRFGWGIVNVNLRAYYGEGSKTVAFEIAEQLGWRSPTAIVAPMAGGSLVSKIAKGFKEARTAGLIDGEGPRLFGAQATGCAPIVRLVESGGATLVPVKPATIARSLAIGAPADALIARDAILGTKGWARAVSDADLVAGIRLLAETSGIFAETAGGVTVAAARSLVDSGHLTARDEVVLCITGNGLKTVEAVDQVLASAPLIDPRLREVAALAAEPTPEPLR